MKRQVVIVILTLLVLVTTGCKTTGGAKVDGVQITLPPNPNQPSSQKVTTREYTESILVGTNLDLVSLKSHVILTNILLPAKVVSYKEQIVEQNLSSSWVRQTVEKLKAMRPVQYLGVAMILLAALSLSRLGRGITGGSLTTTALLAGSGIAMIFLPQIIAGNEKLIIGILVGIPLLWLIAHRHGEHKAKVEVQKIWQDSSNVQLNEKEH